jgi:hypothetical protein
VDGRRRRSHVGLDPVGIKLVKGILSEEERRLALKLKKEKYSTSNWIFKRPNVIREIA